MQTTTIARPGHPRAFTLVELLTVIAIIAVLIAIALPAFNSVQTAGRKASTQSLMTDLSNAAARFELDFHRQPGYFSSTELGASVNGDVEAGGEGLTAMENALLDLAGQDAIVTEEPADPEGWVEVNPTEDDTRTIWVQPDLIGVSESSYFLPPGDALAFMSPEQQPGTLTSQFEPGLPDVLDAFGQPLLAWINSEDVGIVDTIDDFAQPTSDDRPALFYWAANGAMLSSPSLGERGEAMTRAISADNASLIGLDMFDNHAAELSNVMAALLGHPGYPNERALAAGTYDAEPDDTEGMFPRQPRGSFVVHSAGPDGIYLSNSDKRLGRVISADMLSGTSVEITYGVNFFIDPSGGAENRRRGENDQPETIDFLDGFDDLVVTQ